jgi:acetyltransferase
MFKNPNDRELMIGVIRDIVFGPVISFGAGGSLVEVIRDRSLALPPLNEFIIHRLIAETKISKALGPFRNMLAINLKMLVNVLLRVSEMVCELPAISEMDINPLVVNENNIIVLDARIVINEKLFSDTSYSHMAIHPYPSYLMESHKLSNDIEIMIRPIRPEDAEIEHEFVRSLSSQTKFFRFFENLNELSPAMLRRFTQIDYDREMALIVTHSEMGKEIGIGVARYTINPDRETCEFAVVVADAWQNRGIGSMLMTALIKAAKTRGLNEMIGLVLVENTNMLNLMSRFGFIISQSDDPTIKLVTKILS